MALSIQISTVESLPDHIGVPGQPLILMPFIDGEMANRSATQLARRAGATGKLLCIHDSERVGFIRAANTAFRRSQASEIAYVAQDVFSSRNWLSVGLRGLHTRDGGLLAFNDGKWAGALAAFGMATMDWARSNYDGDLFHPAYKRHFADVELTLIAMQQGKLRFDPLSLLVEVDWDKDSAAVEAADRELFRERLTHGFDGRVTDSRLLQLFS
ncbi:hypothetical protein [Sphingomonas hengshuiensis]|uniref:hypothetical protein n=1 Tax=Sphingomonas hengshuiensis TaxID=1609977 RepID=UPI000695DFCA|nr:hypothetical protein [Sphingomonas hengshuiensis]